MKATHIHHRRQAAFCRIPAGLAVLLALAACGATYTPPAPAGRMLDSSGYPSGELNRGYLLHQQNCAKCHAFENPTKHTPEDLARRIMPKMARKAKLSTMDQQAVLVYLLSARRAGP